MLLAALLPKLKFVLLTVRVVLSDAEEKQFTNPFVKEWLDELKDSVYEAEDVLDEIATEALQGNSETTSYKESIELKVEEIIKRLESIAQQKDVLGLTERLGGRPPLRSPSTSLVDESEIFGRENDKKAILDFLLPTFGNANDMPSNQVPARNGVTVVNVNEALESQETKVKGNGALRLPANENGVPANENGIVAKKNAALQAQVNDFIAANQDGVPTVTEDVVFPANENRVPVMRDEKISERDFAAVGVEIPVVAVVGMPGVGKTTLAQLLFNDSRVKKIFDKRRVWVHVSEEFDILKITKTIYQCVTSSFECPADLNSLQVKLQENLEKKKFLFVLDDIWNENFVDWDVLQRPFKAADSQSRIIVTTRSRNVALIMRAAHTYHLKTLSDDDCWSLFAKHAFGPGIPKKHVEKKEIGEEIAKRCNGLPLAAKTLGALLYAKAEIDEWVGVLNSEVWDLPSDKSNILPALRLSYSHLPSHLKRCFAYCSVLPKSKLFEKAHLIMLWRAEGLLPRRKKRLEDVGDEYFRELLSRSFFHDCDKKYFKMHDLFIDLAKSVAAGEFFFKSEDGILHEVPETVRYFSFTAGKVDDSEQFDAFQGANHLRTFLLLKHPSSLGAHRLSTSAFANLMQALKFSHLRVLSLRDYHIGNLHDSIGNLKYLRYLDISGTGIQELGESVCSLYNLETLLLSRCTELKKLPNNMHNLINLQHLDVSRTKVEELPETVCSLYNLETLLLSGCTMLSKLPNDMQNLTNLQHLDISRTTVMEMPPQFGRLKRLHVLTAFVVGDGHSTISELKELSNLRTLSILRLEKVHDGDACSQFEGEKASQ
ncbi:hypothetical protein GH714_004357 [Hevea brasiliensis]|uniref:NB-ARC domain-containing protein n=1 Tax=Hevea brasiliensis TaxID=3981 RepID=A0A6A6L218_HEVBR|nr:hypothetical protein GH714_004357 [Hevea brasiliensis]